MSATQLTLAIVITVVAAVTVMAVVSMIVSAVRDVQVARHTGIDPRGDLELRKDALRQLREQGQQ